MSAVLDPLVRAYWAFTGLLRQLNRDPLLSFHWACEGQRLLVRWLVEECEVLVRCGNSSGKTFGGAAVGVAIARGERELDGEPLPDVPVPNVGWVLTKSYKQQLESAQQAYSSLLGLWPHYIAYVVGKGKGYWETVYIASRKCAGKHNADHRGIDPACSDCPTCSRITFHCEESKSSLGGRVDWVHGDEPPDWDTWSELRGRKKSGQWIWCWITMTPLDQADWQPVSEDFVGCTVYESPWLREDGKPWYGQPNDGRAEIRFTIYDNEFQTDKDIAYFESRWRNDRRKQARFRGDYVHLAGKNPFPEDVLQEQWLPRCRKGKLQTATVLADEVTEIGLQKVQTVCEYEQWYEFEEDEHYLLIADPSMGIKPLPGTPMSQRHDPAGMHLWACVRPRLVLRFNGYVGPYGLGSLAAHWYSAFRKVPQVDCDSTAGYSQPFYQALADHKVHKLVRSTDSDKPGTMDRYPGYRISASNRGSMLDYIAQAIKEGGVTVLSREVIQCWLGVTMDESGRISTLRARKTGKHRSGVPFDEDLTLSARAFEIMSWRAWKPRRPERMSEKFRRAIGIKRAPQAIRMRW